MAYKTYDRQMLADFTGRPMASFPDNFVTKSAIPQALLLFKLGTGLADPAVLSADNQQLVDFAIISMADAVHLAQPYQTALASPFNSESIGSYSYSKVAKAVQQGKETGVMWFDLAIQQLATGDRIKSDFLSGGIEMFENDGLFVDGQLSGNVDFVSPRDVDGPMFVGHDPAPGQHTVVGSEPVGEFVPASWVEDPPGSGLYVQEA